MKLRKKRKSAPNAARTRNIKGRADSDSPFGFGAVGFVVEDWAVEEMRAKKD